METIQSENDGRKSKSDKWNESSLGEILALFSERFPWKPFTKKRSNFRTWPFSDFIFHPSYSYCILSIHTAQNLFNLRLLLLENRDIPTC
jgi:hypothetical protein